MNKFRTERIFRFFLASIALTIVGSQYYGFSNYRTFPTSIHTLWQSITAFKKSLVAHPEGIADLAISSDNKFLASSSDDGIIKVWSLENFSESQAFENGDSEVSSIAFTSNERSIVGFDSEKKIGIWNLGSDKQINDINNDPDHTSSISISPSGDFFSIVDSDGKTRIQRTKDRSENCTFTKSKNSPDLTSISSDGTFLATVVFVTGTVEIWDLSTCKKKYSYNISDVNFALPGGLIDFLNYGSYAQIYFDPENKLLISNIGKEIYLWDIQTGETVHTLVGHSKPVTSISLMPNGDYIVSGSHDKAIKIWSLKTGKLVSTLRGSYGAIKAIEVSPDGKLIFSGSTDGIIRIWRTNI